MPNDQPTVLAIGFVSLSISSEFEFTDFMPNGLGLGKGFGKRYQFWSRNTKIYKIRKLHMAIYFPHFTTFRNDRNFGILLIL